MLLLRVQCFGTLPNVVLDFSSFSVSLPNARLIHFEIQMIARAIFSPTYPSISIKLDLMSNLYQQAPNCWSRWILSDLMLFERLCTSHRPLKNTSFQVLHEHTILSLANTPICLFYKLSPRVQDLFQPTWSKYLSMDFLFWLSSRFFNLNASLTLLCDCQSCSSTTPRQLMCNIFFFIIENRSDYFDYFSNLTFSVNWYSDFFSHKKGSLNSIPAGTQ